MFAIDDDDDPNSPANKQRLQQQRVYNGAQKGSQLALADATARGCKVFEVTKEKGGALVHRFIIVTLERLLVLAPDTNEGAGVAPQPETVSGAVLYDCSTCRKDAGELWTHNFSSRASRTRACPDR